MIPVCLVTGFLGSGKTAFLQRLVERHRRRKLVYLVNEFSAVDVDGRRLAKVGTDTILEGQNGICPYFCIAGGSIFCRCLVTEFIGVLKEARRMFGGKVSGVVVEASGIADPRVFPQMLAETRLDRDYVLASTVTLVDPGSFAKLLRTLPNIRAQIEAADWVLLNKTDLFGAPQVAAAEAEVRRLRPDVRLLRTQYGEAEFDPFEPCGPHAGRGDYAPCVDPHYATAVARIARPVAWERLRKALDAWGAALYRAKGFVPCAAGMRYVDFAAGRWNEEPADGMKGGELVLIVRGGRREALDALKARIEVGEFSA